jgi:ketosteroid isomerase-like protein
MSRDNVERVRGGYEAFNRGDFEAALDGFAPDAEWAVLDLIPDARTYRGPEEIEQFWRTWAEMFEGFRLDVQEIVSAGDRIVAFFSVAGRGRGSGLDVASPVFAQIWTFDAAGGQISRVEMVTEPEAREVVAGVEE